MQNFMLLSSAQIQNKFEKKLIEMNEDQNWMDNQTVKKKHTQKNVRNPQLHFAHELMIHNVIKHGQAKHI